MSLGDTPPVSVPVAKDHRFDNKATVETKKIRAKDNGNGAKKALITAAIVTAGSGTTVVVSSVMRRHNSSAISNSKTNNDGNQASAKGDNPITYEEAKQNVERIDSDIKAKEENLVSAKRELTKLEKKPSELHQRSDNLKLSMDRMIDQDIRQSGRLNKLLAEMRGGTRVSDLQASNDEKRVLIKYLAMREEVNRNTLYLDEKHNTELRAANIKIGKIEGDLALARQKLDDAKVIAMQKKMRPVISEKGPKSPLVRRPMLHAAGAITGATIGAVTSATIIGVRAYNEAVEKGATPEQARQAVWEAVKKNGMVIVASTGAGGAAGYAAQRLINPQTAIGRIGIGAGVGAAVGGGIIAIAAAEELVAIGKGDTTSTIQDVRDDFWHGIARSIFGVFTGAGGAVVGAAAGTLVKPGVGTTVGGYAGGIAGAEVGGEFGDWLASWFDSGPKRVYEEGMKPKTDQDRKLVELDEWMKRNKWNDPVARKHLDEQLHEMNLKLLPVAIVAYEEAYTKAMQEPQTQQQKYENEARLWKEKYGWKS